jgi:hypothetical protein
MRGRVGLPSFSGESSGLFEVTVLCGDLDVFPDRLFEGDEVDRWGRHYHLYEWGKGMLIQ